MPKKFGRFMVGDASANSGKAPGRPGRVMKLSLSGNALKTCSRQFLEKLLRSYHAATRPNLPGRGCAATTVRFPTLSTTGTTSRAGGAHLLLDRKLPGAAEKDLSPQGFVVRKVFPRLSRLPGLPQLVSRTIAAIDSDPLSNGSSRGRTDETPSKAWLPRQSLL